MRELVVDDETNVRVYDRAGMSRAIERAKGETVGQPQGGASPE
jgi:hypothetical protein